MENGRDDLAPIGDLPGQTASAAWADVRGWRVIGGDGALLGEVADVLVDRAAGEPRFLAVALDAAVARDRGGRLVYAPFSAARVDADGRSVHLDAITGTSAPTLPTEPTDELPSVPAPLATEVDAEAEIGAEAGTTATAAVLDRPDTEARVTLSEEELRLDKRTVTAGEVRVEKRVETEHVRETVPVMREDVTIERRPLPPGAGLEPRIEGDVVYVPIVEEELVVEKRLVAREELVIRKHQLVEEEVVEADLRRERAHVEGPVERGGPAGDPPV